MKLRPLYALPVVVLPLLTPACSSDEMAGQTWIPATLRTAESCEALEAGLKVDALLKMTWAIDSQIAAMADDGGNFWGSMRVEEDMAADASGAGQSAPPSAPDHSETNIQVEGVDEADIVKTDGRYIYALHGATFAVLEAWPPTELELATATPVEGFPVEMFVAEGHAAVFSLIDGTEIFQALGLPPRPVPARPYYYGGEVDSTYYPVITKITTFALEGAIATAEREFYVEGQYLSARLVDNHVRAVITGGPEGPPLPTYSYGVYAEDDGESIDALESLRNQNEQRIHTSTLTDWVARRFVREDGILRELPTPCSCYYMPTPGSTTAGHTQLYAFDIDRPDAEPVELHVTGHAQTVYSSAETMIIAGDAFGDASFVPSDVTDPVSTSGTHLHLFDVATDPSKPTYVASGSVPGALLNQFSIDETDGYLRVATSDVLMGGSWTRTNSVYVLQRSGASVAVVGQATGIAPGEQLMAARFFGDRGYLVTFMQIDPLFVVDLANPAAPVVVGELEIPGFSEYVHPLENGDYLLTVGQDGSGWGTTGNPALQLFDVREASNPTLVHKIALPYGGSEAEYNHKAITFYQGMFTLPYTDWTETWTSTLGLYRVDVAAEQIVELGTVDHSALFAGVSQNQYDACSGWGYDGVSMRRGVFIEQTLYALSPAGVTAHPVTDLASTTASVVLPAMGPIDCSFTYGQDWDWGWR